MSLRNITLMRRTVSILLSRQLPSLYHASSVTNFREIVHRSSVMKQLYNRKNSGHCLKIPLAFSSSYPSHSVINLPNLSPTMETGNIVRWAKEEGDMVEEGDILAEIETDKAVMSFDASNPGYLAKILIPTGTRDIPVGTPLCILVEEADFVAAFKDYVMTEKTKPVAPAAAASPGTAPKPQPASTQAPTTPAPAVAAAPPSASPQQQKQPMTSSGKDRVFASPLARRLALEKGVNLIQLAAAKPGTGVSGMIRAADLDGFQGLPKDVLPQMAGSGVFTQLNVSVMRATTAARLTESKRTIPHYYLTTEVEVDELMRMREIINGSLAKQRPKGSEEPANRITLNDIIIKAIASACLKVPECNSEWCGDYIRQYSSVDISVAMAHPDGLIAPVIFDADKKGLLQINEEVNRLAVKAKENTLQTHEFQGGTITLSNLGMFGVSSFSAVIQPPQVCLLAVGNIQTQLMPCADSPSGFRKANLMSVTLSCDHRVVDGAVGATWLSEFKRALESPALMLM